MKTNFTLLLLLITFIPLITNCSEEEETFSITITNPYNFDIDISSSLIEGFTLAANSSRDTKGTAGEGSLFAKKTGNCDECSSLLGEQGSYSDGNYIFVFFPSESYSWTAGENNIYEKTNQPDGNGENCDLANYNGPDSPLTAQADAFCKAAYAYDCAGQTNAKEETCKSLKQAFPSYGCFYCN